MADRIKGITIEIGGDTTGLNKALSGVNKEIRDTQSQLKDVERLLKLDPSNTELLQQKQRLLADAVEETKNKLDTLKNAEQQAQQQFKEGKINQEQYEGLQREIIATSQQLKGFEESAAQAADATKGMSQQMEVLEGKARESGSALSSVSEAAKNIGEKSTAIGQKFLPVTAAISGFGVASVAAMNAVDDGLDVIVKKTGATGDAAKELQEVYNNVAKTIPADFGDIGAAVGEINTRLGFTGEELEKASEQFLKFAAVNDADVNTAVQLVTRAMGDAGIEAGEYASVLDMLTVAGQQSGISVDSLATNLAKYGAPMRALGIDTENAIALFAGWEKAGVNTETAFSGMKKAISNWGAAGKDSGEEFSKTLQAIKDAPDIAEATTLAIEAFGSKAGPDLADAIQGGRFEVEQYIEALKSAGGTVETTYGGIVDEVDDTQLAMQTAQLAMHDIGETIMKTLGPMLLELSKRLSAVGTWFSSLSDGGKKAVIAIAGIVAAIGPVLMIIGKVSGGISFLTSTVLPAISSLGGLGGVITALTGPIGIIVAAIAGFIAIFVVLYKNNEDFRNKVQEIWGQISEIIGAVIGTIKEIISEFVSIATQLWSQYGDDIMLVVSSSFDYISGFIDMAITYIRDILNVVLAVIRGDWSGAWEAVKNLFVNLVNNIKGIAQNWMKLMENLINLGLRLVIDLFVGLRDKTVQLFVSIKDKVLETMLRLKDFLITRVSDIKDTIINGIGEAVEWIKALPEQAIEWGRDMIQGFIKGIKDKASGVVDSIKGIAENIASFLHFSRPDKGPLHYYEEWMPDMLKGLSNGIKDNMWRVTKQLSTLTGSMTMTMTTMPEYNSRQQDNGAVQQLIGMLDGYLPEIAQQKSIVLDGKTLVGETAGRMNSTLGYTRNIIGRAV